MLAIVMPVYNEQASVRKVVTEWFHEIENWTEDCVFLAINDGSTDGTLKILERLREQLGPRLEIHTHTNRGHGQSCLQGYRTAIAAGVQWVFQIDSDGQCDPQYFFRFWRERDNYDVIYGYRAKRDDGWRRILATHVLRFVVFATGGIWCADPNVPYRLMKATALPDAIDRIPRRLLPRQRRPCRAPPPRSSSPPRNGSHPLSRPLRRRTHGKNQRLRHPRPPTHPPTQETYKKLKKGWPQKS